ncbi:sugar phosphate isomerase/epimerase [Micromonospora sp. C31]|uniref:sugar phosphate isomerase/epimerase family protein n=1 Tax=Micromonospora sp. C31 TaxID=2824876 RepID=UPI001B36ED4D|nr:sugar phosphate isomerase/epimerase family protein [Micromonospora sp. C31]MBQ1074883.1 sugar phosphate isomerase/epimerase [Micromonospora sp. C31]
MRIGINTWAWAAPLTDEALAELAPRIRAWGFDAIELTIQAPGDWEPARAADLLAGLELTPAVCAGLLPEHDLLTDDEEVVRRTEGFVRHCVRTASRVGAAVLAGPLYAPAGRRWLLDADARRAAVARLVERLRPLADEAAGQGVTIALEPLNRFETSLLNTVEQALEVVAEVPGLGLALDTFHLNIEERDLPAAIRLAGDRLAHVQVCGNDRGVPGGDHLDWPGMFDALTGIGYRGQVNIESFTAEALAVPMSVWRPLTAAPDTLAVEGLAFLRRLTGRNLP